jgi:alpha-D-xyloside xylohydrolase
VREKAPALEAAKHLPVPGPLPFKLENIRGSVSSSRTVVAIPCDEPGEQIYGFGLDPGAYEQKGLRKYLSVCAGVMTKTGASHAPVPFYLSTKGYGIYVDTARVPVVHVARLSSAASLANGTTIAESGEIKVRLEDLYAGRQAIGKTEVVFEIPGDSRGVDVYVFAGPGMREAVQRYNLFSGGGVVPPLWGLGMKYRISSKANTAKAMYVAKAMREMKIPCDMLGFEPGWQTKAYSCSFKWSDERFPDHQGMLDALNASGYRVNLWEHAYVNPESPLFKPLRNHSGNYLVWGGLVVDFADPEAFRIFADYHSRELVDKGVSGFKLDECDNQPITDCTPFNFPASTTFSSGIDGEQMIQLYGYYYQRSIFSVFKAKNRRTWGDTRASAGLASPLPFNLYSDAYAFDQYLRQLVNASFAGLLWSPEVRNAGNINELMNRVALSSFAPQMCFNTYFMPNPLWEQYNADKNNANQLLPIDEQKRVAARFSEIIGMRYSLIPYIYSCFHRYHTEGLPPIRSLLLDFPNDKKLRSIDNQFLFGDNLMIAPFLSSKSERDVYFPEDCNWIELKTGTLYKGGQVQTFCGTAGDVPVFVRENTLLPWAKPVQFIGRETVFELTVKVFGDQPKPFTLIEDDGETFDYERGAVNRLTLTWIPANNGQIAKTGQYAGPPRYKIGNWEKVKIAASTAGIARAVAGDPAKQAGSKLISADATYTLSSNLGAGPHVPSRLLDPQEDDKVYAIHTNKELAPYVIVDLKKENTITGLVIVNRDDKPSFTKRAASLSAWVSEDGRKWKLAWQAQKEEARWQLIFPEPVRARYVKIGLSSENILHLKRVWIYGH